MAIDETEVPQHWNYFLALEDDILKMSRYLEPATDNFYAYSLELARILFAASSEVDVVAKRLCQKIGTAKGRRAGSIDKYRETIMEHDPRIARSVVSIPKWGLSFTPWEKWDEGMSPLWWDAYNDVKHHRHTHFQQASLKNSLNAVSALYVILLFFYMDDVHVGKLNPDTSLFKIGAPFELDKLFYDQQMAVYRLPSSELT